MITEYTRKSLSEIIKVRDLGEIKVKGKKHPVGMFKILGIGEDAEIVHADIQQVFVNREDELKTLETYYQNLVEHNFGGGVLLKGDTGIGKTALLTRFFKEKGNVEQIQITTDTFNKNIPYSVILKLLKKIFKISTKDSQSKIKEKILKELTVLGRDLYESITYIDPLFGFETGKKDNLTPEQRKWKIFDTISNILIRKAAFNKFIIAVDDFNFADDLSREFFDVLFLMISDNPILILLTSKVDIPLSSIDDGILEILEITGLSENNVGEIINLYLKTDYSPEDFVNKIFEISHGNPLFVLQLMDNLLEEELIEIKENKLFLTKPLNEIKIPDNVNTIALSKIDALPENHRKFLQYASVFGNLFDGQIVGKMVNFKPGRIVGSLRVLEERGFVIPSGKEDYYEFIHSTIQEAAYETLLKGKRAQLHSALGKIYEEKFKDKIFENLEVLAFHFGRSSNYKKGIDYLLKAAEKDKELFANYQVIEYCTQALENLKKLSKSKTSLNNKLRLKIILGETYKLLGNFELALENFEELLKTSRSINDEISILNSENWIASTCYAGGDLEKAEKCYNKLLEDSQNYKNKKYESNALIGLGAVFEEQNLNHAREFYNRAYKIKLLLDDQEGISDCMNLIGNINLKQGNLEDAKKYFDNSLQIKKRLKDRIKEIRILNNLGLIYSQKIDFKRSNENYHQALTISKQVGDKPFQATILANLGTNLINENKFGEAKKYFEEAEYISKVIKDEQKRSVALNQLALIEEEMGNFDTAKQFYRTALEISKKINLTIMGVIFEGNLGIMLIYEGKLSKSKELLENAIQAGQDLGINVFKYYYKSSLARNYFYLGLFKESIKLVDEVNTFLSQNESYDILFLIKEVEFDIYAFLGILKDYQSEIEKLLDEAQSRGFNKFYKKLLYYRSKIHLENKEIKPALNIIEGLFNYADEIGNNYLKVLCANKLLSIHKNWSVPLINSFQYLKSQKLSWLLLETYANLALNYQEKYLEDFEILLPSVHNKISIYKSTFNLSNKFDKYKYLRDEYLKEINKNLKNTRLKFNI